MARLPLANPPTGGARLDAASFEPLYLQAARLLKAGIAEGKYVAGDRLPSEHELISEFGISRTTAVAALDELVRSHAAYRLRGRGTFVSKPLIGRFSLSSGFSDDLRSRGLEPSSRVVSFNRSAIDEEVAERLGAPMGESYFRLVRLRLADGEPVALQTAYLPVDLYPDLDKQNFETANLYEVMRRSYEINPQWAEAVAEAVLPTADEASSLAISPDAPVMLVWHLALDDRFQPLEFVRSTYRGDRFTFASGRQLMGSA